MSDLVITNRLDRIAIALEAVVERLDTVIELLRKQQPMPVVVYNYPQQSTMDRAAQRYRQQGKTE